MITIIEDTDLNTKSGLSIIYFYAPYLIFHGKIIDDLLEVENSFPNVKYYGVDIIQFKNLIVRYNLSSLPTILILGEEGKVIKNVIGLQAVSNIKSIVRDIYEMSIKGVQGAKS
jgi:hypothetical protein